jgi:hypothetical protein
VAHDLVAPRRYAALALRIGVGRPNLGQKPRREQARQRPGVNLVGLYMRVRDRLHLQRIGDHDPAHERREDP